MAVLLASTMAGQRDTFVPANDVSFSISIEKRAYKAGDEIVVHYSIVNISNRSVYVPREWDVKCPASPHVWAWFEDSNGKHFIPGYGGSCVNQPKSVTERMDKEAVLLRPNQHLDGTFRLDTSLFGLPAGEYRIEATLSGWREQDFTDTEWSELAKMGGGFLSG